MQNQIGYAPIDLATRDKSFYVVADRQTGKSSMVTEIAKYFHFRYQSVAVIYPNWPMARQHKNVYSVYGDVPMQLERSFVSGLHVLILDDFDMMRENVLDMFLENNAIVKIAFGSPPTGGIWQEARMKEFIRQMENQGIIGVGLNGKENKNK